VGDSMGIGGEEVAEWKIQLTGKATPCPRRRTMIRRRRTGGEVGGSQRPDERHHSLAIGRGQVAEAFLGVLGFASMPKDSLRN